MADLTVTHIRLNRNHPAAAREIRDVCRMHARVVDATVAMPDGPRVLWAHPAPGLLVVRATEPVEPGRLPDGYAEHVTHQLWTPPPVGRCQAVIAFATRAPDPAVAGARPHGARGARRHLDNDPDRETWLRQILTPFIDRMQIRIVGGYAAKGWHRDKHLVTHWIARAVVEGNVTDHDGLIKLARAGVGRAKAYGGGLTLWQKV